MEMYTKDSGPRGFWPQELCARETVFFCKRVVQGFVVCLRYVQSCAREILSRELCKNVFLPERCQKLCKRDSFKRVLQECFFCQRDVKSCAREILLRELCKSDFFLSERCPGLHKIYCCPDSGAKERFTYFCFI
jgi:hypothetical protein